MRSAKPACSGSVCQPRYGGPEVDPVTLVDVLAAVAAGDGAAGWCAMIASTSGLMAAFLEPARPRSRSTAIRRS